MEQETVMLQKDYFRKCSFCNVVEVTDQRPSGDLPHAHDYTQIWFITHGCCEHSVDGNRYTLIAGDAFLLLPGVPHSTRLQTDSSAISVETDLNALLPPEGPDGLALAAFLESTHVRRAHFVFRHELTGQVEALTRTMLREYQEEQPLYQDFLRLKLRELLLFVREVTLTWDARPADALYERYKAAIGQATAYIDDHYHENLSLDEVCRVAALSKTYFCALFKQFTGRTYVEYFTEKRIQKARELLERPELTISQIGGSLGFGDVSSFSRTFKKAQGVSPMTYRKIHTDMAKA